MGFEIWGVFGIGGLIVAAVVYMLIESRATTRYYQKLQDDHDQKTAAFKRELEIKNRPSGGDDDIIGRL